VTLTDARELPKRTNSLVPATIDVLIPGRAYLMNCIVHTSDKAFHAGQFLRVILVNMFQSKTTAQLNAWERNRLDPQHRPVVFVLAHGNRDDVIEKLFRTTISCVKVTHSYREVVDTIYTSVGPALRALPGPRGARPPPRTFEIVGLMCHSANGCMFQDADEDTGCPYTGLSFSPTNVEFIIAKLAEMSYLP
jgi:hypothetical protein